MRHSLLNIQFDTIFLLGGGLMSRFQFSPTTDLPLRFSFPPPETEDVKGRLLIPEEGCGYVKTSTTRIAGGGIAKNGAWPWMSLLGFKNSTHTIYYCGGSLITSKHVLTAAHCFKVVLNFARLGEWDYNTDSDGPHQDIKIADHEVHEAYNTTIKIHDIAIIYLERDVDFTGELKLNFIK